MRNAILLADEQAGINGVDRALIWEVFASRGMGYAASAVDTDDVHPLQDFTRPPAPAAATGSVAGTVRDLNTRRADPEALVAFAGHDSGLGEDLVHSHHRHRQLPDRRGARPARVELPHGRRRRGLRPREHSQRAGRARGRGHAQLHAPAQLGAGLRRDDRAGR